MQKKTKVLLGIGSALGILLSSSSSAFAVNITLCNTNQGQNQFYQLCQLQGSQLGTIIGNTVTILLVLAAILALFFLIYGGIRWITSAGDKAKLDLARSTMTAAIVGLILTLLSFMIINIVTFVVSGESFQCLSLPSLVQGSNTNCTPSAGAPPVIPGQPS